MAASTIFGYRIEDQEGKLVITVEGAFAQEALKRLRAELDNGRRVSVKSYLSPLMPLNWLLGRAARRAPQPESSESFHHEQEESDDENVDELLNQGVEQVFAEFQHQLSDFRKTLDELKGKGNALPQSKSGK